MAYTVASDVAGEMATLQAYSTARFAIGSRLWPHIYPVASTNANTVQIPILPAPSPVTSATAETSSLSDAAISIGAASMSPAQIAAATIISTKAMLGGAMVKQHALDVLINNVIAGFDYDICTEFDDFEITGDDDTSVASITVFKKNVSALRNIGFGGELHGCLTIAQVDLILAGMYTYGAIPQNEAYIRDGYIGRVAGVELVGVPDSFTQTSTNEVGAIWYREFGIGVGYHAGDTVGGVMEGTGAPAPLVHLSIVPIDAISTRLSAAIFALASQISVSGGICTKYALS